MPARVRRRLLRKLQLATAALGAGVVLLLLLLIAPGAISEAWRPAVRVIVAGGNLALLALAAVTLRQLAEAERAADAATAEMQQLIEALPTGLVLWDAEGRLLMANADFRRLYRPIEDLIQPGVPFSDMIRAAVQRGLVPEAAGCEAAWLDERLASFGSGAPVLRRRADGRWRRIVEQRLANGGVLGYSVDITELVAKEQALEEARAESALARHRLEDAIDALPAGFELYDANDRLVMINRVMGRMYPLIKDLAERDPPPTFEEMVRANHARGGLPHLPDEAALESWLALRLADRKGVLGGAMEPRESQLPDGRWVRIHEQRTREGGVVGVRIDITELRRMSDTDSLTGLANRRAFDIRLTAECARAARHGLPLALVVADVDFFKRYNDFNGHPSGDAVLRVVAELLRAAAARTTDLAARIGGEEFALLLPHLGEEDARLLVERLRLTLAARAVPHGDSPLGPRLTLSIGIATLAPGQTANDLLAAADAALYAAKKAGRDRCVLAV